MIEVKVSLEDRSYVRRTNDAYQAGQFVADAVRDFEGKGALVTVHGFGSHAHIGAYVAHETT
jgi:hypothetical protein